MSKIPSIYGRMKTSPKTLGICPITGIILTIDIPFLPGNNVLEYNNPLADIGNAKDIALLPYQEQSKISPHILAGCLLTILDHYDLIQDKLSSTERNELLCTVPIFYLSEALHFLASNTSRRISLFPPLSLSIIGECRESSTFHIVKNYIEICESQLLPSTSINNVNITIRTEKKRKILSTISSDIRKECKSLISSILESVPMNSKMISLLHVITQGNNLITMSSELRDKLILKLESFEDIHATKLANILSDIREKNKGESETILNTTEISSSFPALPKRSLAEILESKKRKFASLIDQELTNEVSEEEDENEF